MSKLPMPNWHVVQRFSSEGMEDFSTDDQDIFQTVYARFSARPTWGKYPQEYRFSADYWTLDAVRKWMRNNNAENWRLWPASIERRPEDIKPFPEVRRPNPPEIPKKNGRWHVNFVGRDDGYWYATDGYLERIDWNAAAALSSRNEWRNLSVEGATEYNAGFLVALREMVAAYPELIDWIVSFDGPYISVRDLLARTVGDLRDVVFYHGTSSAAWDERIKYDGLQPRSVSGVEPAYGAHIERAKKARSDVVYLTTQLGMANFAASDAARATHSKPVVLRVSRLEPERMLPDEDSRETTAMASLGRIGSIAYRGTIRPDHVELFERRENSGKRKKLVDQLNALRFELATVAQREYDDWQPDEEDFDAEVGGGGICDRVADAMANVISGAIDGVEFAEGGQEGDDHAFLYVYDDRDAYLVDIPPGVYESGGGYSWRKKKDVVIKPEHIDIYPVEIDDVRERNGKPNTLTLLEKDWRK